MQWTLTLGMLGLLLMGSGCSNTRMESSWTNPEIKNLNFKKVVAIAAVDNIGMRRTAEDEMVRSLEGVSGVASYRILGDKVPKDSAALRQFLTQQGFDGAVLLQVQGVDTEYNYAPQPTPTVGLYGYYDTGYYGTGMYVPTRVVRVQTNIFDVASGKLVWSGTSRTSDPSSIKSLVDSVGDEARKDLQKQGLLPS